MLKRRPRGAAYVNALVSGYAHPVRMEKPLAFVQAYADDSASDTGDRRLFMAGYINTAHKWALFSDAWAAELSEPPSIKYLKMVEANSLRGQFWGWEDEDRDEKLRGLARVIRHFAPASFEFSVSRALFDALIAPNAPHGLGKPHFACVYGVISSLSRLVAEQSGRHKIEFIFDEQSGVDVDIALLWNGLRDELPKKARQAISGLPSFRDDKELLPLQAADMIAWHIRRENEIGSFLPMADLLRSSDGHYVVDSLDERLPDLGMKFGHVPGVEHFRTKAEWQKARREIALNAKPLGSQNSILVQLLRSLGIIR